MNSNCLEGRRCPQCQSDGPFQVVASSVFLITDDGTEEHQDVEFDEASAAYCVHCDWSGNWGGLALAGTVSTSACV